MQYVCLALVAHAHANAHRSRTHPAEPPLRQRHPHPRRQAQDVSVGFRLFVAASTWILVSAWHDCLGLDLVLELDRHSLWRSTPFFPPSLRSPPPPSDFTSPPSPHLMMNHKIKHSSVRSPMIDTEPSNVFRSYLTPRPRCPLSPLPSFLPLSLFLPPRRPLTPCQEPAAPRQVGINRPAPQPACVSILAFWRLVQSVRVDGWREMAWALPECASKDPARCRGVAPGSAPLYFPFHATLGQNKARRQSMQGFSAGFRTRVWSCSCALHIGHPAVLAACVRARRSLSWVIFLACSVRD